MKKDKIESVTIILPCLGGSKREFPYPKELARLTESMSVIDYPFQHILASRVKPRVVVIVGQHKIDVAKYLYEKYNNKVELVFIFQRNNDEEILSAIRSVEYLFSDKNILFMPDTIIEYKENISLIDKILETLDHQPFVFVCKEETSITRLKLSGTLHIKSGEVVGYEDKPLNQVGNYNAFWVSYGFKNNIFNEVISIIEQSRLKKPNFKKVFQKSVIYKTSPIKITESANINTWTNLNAYLMRQYLIKSGVDPEFLKIHQ